MSKDKGNKPIAAFDLDGSLVREQLLVLLLKECFELQIFPRVTELAFKKVRLAHRDRKISHDVYEKRLIELFEERIKGKLKSDVEAAAEIVAEKHRDWLYVFSRTLLETLRPTHSCITITGAMTETVNLLAPYWGFEQVYGTVLETRRGRYTGRNRKLPVADKKSVLEKHLQMTGADLKGSVALGDTSSDICLLASVETPIAFNPSNTLASEAERRCWPIVIERKDCIYLLQGGTVRRFRRDQADEAVRFVLTGK